MLIFVFRWKRERVSATIDDIVRSIIIIVCAVREIRTLKRYDIFFFFSFLDKKYDWTCTPNNGNDNLSFLSIFLFFFSLLLLSTISTIVSRPNTIASVDENDIDTWRKLFNTSTQRWFVFLLFLLFFMFVYTLFPSFHFERKISINFCNVFIFIFAFYFSSFFSFSLILLFVHFIFYSMINLKPSKIICTASIANAKHWK